MVLLRRVDQVNRSPGEFKALQGCHSGSPQKEVAAFQASSERERRISWASARPLSPLRASTQAINGQAYSPSREDYFPLRRVHRLSNITLWLHRF